MTKGAARRVKARQKLGAANRRETCLNAVDCDVFLIFVEGHDDAILGVSERGGEAFVVYCQARIVRKFRSRDGMGLQGAAKFFDYNIAGSFSGPKSPVFFTPLSSL